MNKTKIKLVAFFTLSVMVGVGTGLILGKNIYQENQKTVQNNTATTSSSLKIDDASQDSSTSKEEVEMMKEKSDYMEVKEIIEGFTKNYFTTNSNVGEATLEKVKEYLSEDYQSKLLPFGQSENKESVSEISPFTSNTFLQLESLGKRANAISFAVINSKNKEMGNVSMEYILKFELKKNAEEKWKINDFVIVANNMQFPHGFYK